MNILDFIFFKSTIDTGINYTSPINMDIVSSINEPVNAKENTIWVYSNLSLNNVYMTSQSNYTPNVANEGDFLLIYRASSPLTTNSINIGNSSFNCFINILEGKIYSNSQWNNATLKIYRNGKFEPLLGGSLVLFETGKGASVPFTLLTSADLISTTAIYKTDAYSTDQSRNIYGFRTTNAIDLSGWSSLKFYFTSLKCGNKPSTGHNGAIYIGCGTSASEPTNLKNQTYTKSSDGGMEYTNITVTIDISSINQNAFIGLQVSSYSSAGFTGYTCTNIYLE